MNPTTQLVEAIQASLQLGTCNGRNPRCEHITAIMSAVANSIEAKVGEDKDTVTALVDPWPKFYEGINSEKARMRTFTAALRERATTSHEPSAAD